MSSSPHIDPRDEPSVWPEKVIGGKYIRLLQKQLQNLREVDAHGNQQLFLDDVFVVYLLAFFNPTIRSLRTIEDFSQTVQAQKHLSISKICKSTLSDFNQLADPERLQPILVALRSQLNGQLAGKHTDRDLAELLRHTIAVDGTFVPAMADVAWAVANANKHSGVRHRARLDMHLAIDTWVPEAIVVPDVGQSEADSASARIQEGKIYLYDRGFMSYDLVRTHYRLEEQEELQPRAQFVIRFKAAGSNSPALCEVTERPLTDTDRAAGVVSDRVGYFLSSGARRGGVSAIKVREVVIEVIEDGQPKTLRLITNLLDISAANVGLLYRHRWQVELFFRWLKTFGNFGHLISHAREGVLTHFYVAIIAVLLMYLHTGFRPSKYLFAMLTQVAMGSATLDEILPILRERERRSQLDRDSRARRRAKKKS